MEYYTTIFSWGFLIVAGGFIIAVYRPDLYQKLIPAVPSTTSQHTTTSKAPSKKQKAKQGSKTGKESSGSDNIVANKTVDDARSSKKRKIVGPVDKTVTATAVNGQKKELPRDADHNIGDRDFAQQLARAQAGTKLQSNTQQKAPKSARLATTIESSPAREQVGTTEHSSTAGQDADDDMSSSDSPQQKPSSGKDISDMLEPSAAAPTTLRLTNVSNEQKKPKTQAQKFEQVTNKKKRAEQARNEQRKRDVQESDRLHEQKKQEQLRRARMAEGTSNQTKANSFVSTTPNAWQNKNAGTTNGGVKPTSAPLLDTFEPHTETKPAVQSQPMSDITNKPVASNATALKAEIGENRSSALAASGRKGGTWTDQTSLSEEEQLQRLREQEKEDAWEPVQTKKAKRKGRRGADTSSEASGPSSRATSRAPIAPIQTSSGKTNGVVKPKDSMNRFASIQSDEAGGPSEVEWHA